MVKQRVIYEDCTPNEIMIRTVVDPQRIDEIDLAVDDL